ncbi:YopT-type cysteine protease domain-containing protein [Pasteurella multocida]|uniref:PfhB1 n=5 Tax=Pasteurella multocida TaxID=747 RepID=Q9CPI1_PASMU|nr:YopT-type cysteine protease domain-containing protein [Pasteurella multocida]AAK02141.1 PfhB1 [Pasteurella multocida subsp. multocida str. Pm70]APW55767.1 filamentous hemagglutinin protein [Pasteurella multocida subsp. multocida str. HN07]AWB54093.1 YopT-type cysteine protease domain-containing protein [Pasteurella multocida]TCH95802.1 YopT-type cysteine protease domain-containing protein [Pasteurella multocida]UOP48387.1 YopT-type cysteine protease domain-containing protein [Pasteurella mu
MNKNRYKLIFSKTKGCLVPVAETINSAVGNASSKDVSDTEISASQPALNSPLSTLFVLVKTAFNPVSTLMSLTWKEYAVLLLSVVSFPLMAQASDTDSVVQRKPELTDVTNNTRYHVELDKAHHDAKGDHQTKIKHTENHVIIVDIAKPNQNGISDNRFKKFNIPNGAVFNNSAKEKRSQLVGYLPGNQNLTEGAEAKAILNQVTGPDASKIEGALEILGQKADLVIANQNGIVLNGVKTINANRFVATTSSTIDPEQMQLNVTQGTVTIGVDGFATDGLPYLDIIAKKIEQKQAITKERTGNSETDITFVAGNSKYDLNTHQVTEKHTAEAQGEIAISGASTGAMYGKNIKLIVTDKGAGVKHDGIILSEADIQIETHEGDVELGNTKNNQNENYAKVHAEGNFTVKGGKHVIIGKEVKANKAVDIQAQETTVRQNAKLTAKTSAKIAASKSVNLEDNAKLIANELSTTTDKLTNKGSIYGKKVTLDADNLVNSKEIYASSELDIKTKGRDLLLEDGVNQPLSFLKGTSLLAPGFVNTGLIHSNGNAKLTFKDDTSFVTEGNNFITAKDNLEITAKNVQIDQAKNIQLNANITINTKSGFVNYGTLASAQNLTINTEQGSIYNIGGILGAGKNLNLSAKRGENQGGYLINQGKSLLHSEGAMNLTADRTVYNLGNIFAKGDATINANALINDVTLTGRLEYQDLKKDYTRYYRINETAKHGWHNNFYELNVNVKEIDKPVVEVQQLGSLRTDGNLIFNSKRDNERGFSSITNHGVINVKGTFRSDADEIVNEMKLLKFDALSHFFQQEADVTIHYKPYTRHIFFRLGNTERNFKTFGDFLDALLSPSPIIKANLYSAENFSAYKLLQQVRHSPMLQKGMVAAFGENWHQLSHEQMTQRWKAFKQNPTSFVYYPEQKAKILAGSLALKTNSLQNGEHSIQGGFDGQLQIGKHTLTLPQSEFIPEVADKEINDTGVDLSALSELLDIPNLFIDNSVQLDKKTREIDEDELKIIEGEQPNYLDPDEIAKNGRLLNSYLKELNEEQYIDEEAFYEERRLNNQRFESLPRALQERLHHLFEEKRLAEDRKRQELLEKARLNKEKAQKERTEKFKEEEKRQEEDGVAKAQETLERAQQEALAREMEEARQAEIARQAQQAEEAKRAAEEKAQREKAEKQKAEEIAEQQLKEELKVLEEEAKKATEIAKQSLFKAVDEARPKVQTDPLYRTQLKYINQDDYKGADYFFNQVASDSQTEQKVNVLGDNYFDHQLITRSIEKKVDNQLAKKYNLSNVDLVKRLIDNSSVEAKDLGLKIGESLTQEQQAKLKQDIVWYVKTQVKGKDVFVPQVYLAQSTLAEAQKSQGRGHAVIHARDVEIKAGHVSNSGTLAGDRVKIEAEGKIQNKGSILSRTETRLVGQQGIENLARSHASKTGGSDVQGAEIRSEGHLHLETDKNASITLQASDVKGKTGFIKTGDLNLKDAHKTEQSYDVYEAGPLTFSPAESYTERRSKATSVGSNVEVDRLHLAVEKDVNQVGSTLKTQQLSGIVKGDYKTQAGKNVTNLETEEYTSHLYGSAHASGGGRSARYDYNSKEGGKASSNVPTTNTGVGAELGLAIRHTKTQETLLTHTNSELQAESGTLHVLGNADIGGVNINSNLPTQSNTKGQTDTPATNANVTAKTAKTDKTVSPVLSASDINALMSEKSAEFFAQEKPTQKQGFELSARDITSTKQKDEYDRHIESTTLKIGPEAEAHSAIADAVSHLAKQFIDAQNGIKQDGTVVLQQASDVLNVITGDLVGGSVKGAFERTKEIKHLTESSDIRTKLGGNLVLSAREGSIHLKNVESAEKTNLTLKAKQDVNIQAGEKDSQSDERLSRVKIYGGANAGCSAINAGCTAGVSVGIEGNESISHERKKSFNNSLLQAQHLKIESGGDLNLESSNIHADKLDLHVKGKTNIISKQDTLHRTQHSVDYSASVGASLSTSTIVKPTGNVGLGYSHETETRGTVNKQAGIRANQISGEIQDLNLQAGYIVNKGEPRDFNVKGQVNSTVLHDRHDKDGGSAGVSIGANENGVSALNLRGGRAEQKHYAATQKSTLAGVNPDQSKIVGQVEKDLSLAKEVTRDDNYASTHFSFETLDIVELGKKAKEKLSPAKEDNATTDAADDSSTHVYEEIPDLYSKLGDSNSDIARHKAEAENHVYEEIANNPYNRVGDSNADFKRNKVEIGSEYAEVTLPRGRQATDPLPELPNQGKAKAVEIAGEPIYAEIGESTSHAKRPLPPIPATQPEGGNDANADSSSQQAPASGSTSEGATLQPRVKASSTESEYETIPFESPTPIVKQGEKEAEQRESAVNTETEIVSKPVTERVQQRALVEQPRSFLQKLSDQLQPLKVKHKIDAVRSSVEEFGGEVSFKYAQSKGEVYNEIVKHVDTQHGVCESTCAHWIANKVSSQGEDFWNTMYEGGKKGHLKQEAIDSIKKLQTEFIQSGSATQQFKLTDNWLQEQGVVPKEKKVGDLSRRDEVAGTVSKSDISALTKAILDTGSDTAGAKKISINLEGGSHTVSALIQGEKVVFFDPNFGEMTFPSHQKFETWLKEAFWEKSGYAGKKEGKRFFNVVNYHAETK